MYFIFLLISQCIVSLQSQNIIQFSGKNERGEQDISTFIGNPWVAFQVTCISGSIPVLNAKTRLAAAPIILKTLLASVPGML